MICSNCNTNDLIVDRGARACPECDLMPADPPVYTDGYGVYTPQRNVSRGPGEPITHCVNGCGSRLTIADGASVCRQCQLGAPFGGEG